MSCGVGCKHSLDLALLRPWLRSGATALIPLLAWESPYAAGTALKSQKKKKEGSRGEKRKKKKKKKNQSFPFFSSELYLENPSSPPRLQKQSPCFRLLLLWLFLKHVNI